MDYEEIVKKIDEITTQPNMRDYNEQSKSFNWNAIESELDFFNDGKLNMAYECIDRHLKTPLKDKLAFIWEGLDGEVEQYTFQELSLATNKFANVLKKYGVTKGDRVFVFLKGFPSYISHFLEYSSSAQSWDHYSRRLAPRLLKTVWMTAAPRY
jgi:acetyl-CoA synthetase